METKGKVLLIIGNDFQVAEALEKRCKSFGFPESDIVISTHAATINTDYAVFTKLWPTHTIILECDVQNGQEDKGVETWRKIKSLAKENQIIIPCGHSPINDEKTIRLPFEPLELKRKLEV